MALPSDATRLVAAACDGDRRALARLISLVENGRPAGGDALAAVYPRTGGAHIVGITGAPGAGKSTLTDGLIGVIRDGRDEVAVLAVDPSSPYTGGAILGDRIRMQDHASDAGVYIRSMASRGHLGGVSAATPKALAILDAVGFPYVLVETVGVGQAEVEIVENADTTMVVVNPGWGDTIQASKAGLLEIGDLFVVNKADRPGVDETVRDLNQMLDFGAGRSWRPPVLTATATAGAGVADVWHAVLDHRRHLEASGELEERRRARIGHELTTAVAERLWKSARSRAGAEYDEVEARVIARELDPWSAAAVLVGGD